MSSILEKKTMYWIIPLTLIISGAAFLSIITSSSQLDILPLIIESRHHPKPQRTPSTFAEEHGPNASLAKLTFLGDSKFSFKYKKSEKQENPFTGVWFPLENLNIDFSKYDFIDINIETKLARRIPFNLSVQTKKETHQYVRSFIEIIPNQTFYTLELDKFITPDTWYKTNNISQIEIPRPDLSRVEALSFESCQLLETGVEDEFIFTKITLKKDLFWTYTITISLIILLIALQRAFFIAQSKEDIRVIHVPIKRTDFEHSDDHQDDIMLFLGENYTSANLTVSDVAIEFGKSNNELAKLIKENTKMTFPQYLNYLRIEEAKRLLKNKHYKTIAEIGYTVGFNSPSNFIRVFKNLEGTSPKNFSEGSNSYDNQE
tara:strand:- start:542 stop:1663 length:1122 start_codon:yes stop_codon:yes gene_type:complete